MSETGHFNTKVFRYKSFQMCIHFKYRLRVNKKDILGEYPMSFQIFIHFKYRLRVNKKDIVGEYPMFFKPSVRNYTSTETTCIETTLY